MARKKSAPSKSARRPGRPPKSEPVVTLAVLARIEDLHLRGFSLRDIAALVKVDPALVARKIDGELRARWKEAGVTRLEDDLARVAMLERVAWQAWEDSQKPEVRKTAKYELPQPFDDPVPKRKKAAAKKSTKEAVAATLKAGGVNVELVERTISTITKVGAVAYLDIIKWCIEFRAKLGGYFEKDTAGATGQLIKVMEVVVDTPDQIKKMMEFEEYERRLVLTDRKIIDVEPAG